jgi:leucyl aminopeptidase
MEIRHTSEAIRSLDVEALVVGVYQEGRTAAADELDAANGGVVSRLQELGEFKAEVGKVLPLYFLDGVKSPLVVLTGLGRRQEVNGASTFRAAASASRWLAERARRRCAMVGDANWPRELAESAVVGSAVGCHGAGLYQAEPTRIPPQVIEWTQVPPAAVSSGASIAEGVNLARRLVNEPPSVIYPESLAQVARQTAAEAGMDVEVWDEERLRAERCGALLAVAQGSARPPRLVILTYAGSDSSAPWLALVGKGVTFDSGGLSLKPSEGMLTMKCDMAGAAAVLGAMQAIAQLRLPLNVMALMGLVENMPSATSYKLGDVLTARNGKTIEVHNTDAEGRLVLADVLSVAVDRGAARIIDLATLTGACMVALGTDVAGVMTNDQPWCDAVRAAADRAGERVWQLPMFAEYAEQIKSQVADMKNVGEGRWGGAITAAKLLEEFVAGRPWVHLDIAGPAFLEKPKPWLDAGGSGSMVRTLVEVARQQSRT